MGADQTFVKVNSSTLTAKANDLTADYPTISSSALPPCMLLIAGLAMQKIDQNFQQLLGTLAAGKAEAARLAACLTAAGRAYDEADALAHADIQSGGGATGAGSVSVNPDLPPEAPPVPLGQCTAPPEDSGTDWIDAVAQFDTGDQGSSLMDFTAALFALSDQLVNHAKKFSMANVHWEGKAAEAAESGLRQHESWLYELAQQTQELAQQSRTLADVHISEHPRHPTSADVASVNSMSTNAAMDAYAKYQVQSDDVRTSYASRVNFADLMFKQPPAGAYPTQSVSTGDVAPSGPGGTGGGSPTQGSPASGGAGGGSPASPGGTGSSAAQSPTTKPAAAESGSGQPPSGGGQPGGGSPGGGSPSEGAGSGGGLPGGLGSGLGGPGSGLGGLPDDPGLTPAAAGGGGAGAGGGGGGIGGQPLQPAASAPPLGTSPASGGIGAGPGAGGSAGGMGGGGAMGGGMGGMGHGNREGGKEKKRNPNLSEDEALYVEDRPYTDPVIGHIRRTKIDDKKESR